jgi:DNA-binding transcriptional LysR family regulator
MSKFERIATFVTVFEEGSFAACAKKLNISPAAVSKQVSLLEKELGFELLSRSTRKLALTEAGGVYFEQAQKILSEMAEIDALALEMRKEPFGKMRVASQRYFAESYILPHLAQFLLAYPKIQLNLELIERFPDLEREEIDIVIGMSRSLSESSIQKTLGYTRYVMCASPEYLKAFGTPKNPQELKRHRYINHVLRTPVNITKFGEGLEIYLEPYLLLNDTNAMKTCAVNGIGIVKLHQYVVEDSLKEGTLLEILADYNEPKQPIYVSFNPHKHTPPKIRVFLDFFHLKPERTG